MLLRRRAAVLRKSTLPYLSYSNVALHTVCTSHLTLTTTTANPRPGPSRRVRVQLLRLPEDHSVDVRDGLHRQGYTLEARAGTGESEDVWTG